MSKRPIEMKQRRKAARAFRTQLPRFFDLVQWLIDHGHARTRREARALISDEKVRKDSHVLGVRRNQVVFEKGEFVTKNLVDPRVPVEMRDGIIVASA